MVGNGGREWLRWQESKAPGTWKPDEKVKQPPETQKWKKNTPPEWKKRKAHTCGRHSMRKVDLVM